MSERAGVAYDPSVRRLADALAMLVVGIGTTVLVVGWWLGVDIAAQLLPDTASMKANTALGFILAGGSLLAILAGRRTLGLGLGAVLVLLTGATLLEYVSGASFGIDELLADDHLLAATASPGRMGVNTAVAFTAIGVATLLGHRPGPARAVAQTMAVLTGSLAFMALQGYLFDATQARGIGSATQMAPHTAIAMMMVAIAFLAAHSDTGVLALVHSPGSGSRLMRRLLPAVALAVLATAAVVVILGRVGIVEDPNLSLAVLSTMTIVLVSGAILLVGQQLERTDAERRAAEQDLSSIVLAFPDLHVRVASDGTIGAVYGALTSELSLEAQVGEHVRDVLPAGVAQRIEAALSDEGGDVSNWELSFSDPDSDATLQARAAPTAGGLVVSIRDISQLARVQRELEELNAELEERVEARTHDLHRSNQELERFAYVASHDLQEPLRMVSAFVARLSEKYGDVLDERGQQYVRFAVEGAQRMAALIEALLEFSRAGRSELEMAPIDLGHVVDQVSSSLGATIERTEGTVHRHDLPTVLGDEVLLRQVLQNLISNALKFRAPDRAPAVLITGTVQDEVATISVADNGIGIPDEFRETVFAVFRRLNARTDYEGTGIGLSIVERLVQRHGGDIWVEAQPDGRGTIFRFTLPAADEGRPR